MSQYESMYDYLRRVKLAPAPEEGPRMGTEAEGAPAVEMDDLQAAVNAGSILSFVEGLSAQQVEDVLFSVQFAERAADGRANRFTQTRRWYEEYVDMLQNLGWVTEQFGFTQYDQGQEDLQMDAAVIRIIASIATAQGLGIVTQALDALEGLADDDKRIEIFDFYTSEDLSGNFQIGAVQKAPNGVLSLALGAFYFKAVDRKKKFLFFSWGRESVNLWAAAQKMTLNGTYYDNIRQVVKSRITADLTQSLAEIQLARVPTV